MNQPSDPFVSFELQLHLVGQPPRWHASLRNSEESTVLEFDAPIELLRYLAAFPLGPATGPGLR